MGMDQNFFLTMIQQIYYIVFAAAWSSNYFFHSDYILKAIVYFNSWQLQIIYFTISLPEIIYLENIAPSGD